LYDRDITINFSVVIGEVILMLWLLFISFKRKKNRKEKQSVAMRYRLNWNFWWNWASIFSFLKENDVLSKTSSLFDIQPLTQPFRGQIPLFSRVFRQFLCFSIEFLFTCTTLISLVVDLFLVYLSFLDYLCLQLALLTKGKCR
jgi:hypothetical protein